MKARFRFYQGATVLLVLAAFLVWMAQPAAAQVLYGSIVGSVEDQSGALVPNAAITLTSQDTGVKRETMTDVGGRYSLLNVLPGAYELRIIIVPPAFGPWSGRTST